MKKVLSIVFLCMFLFNTMGYYFVFRINQSFIRSEVKGIIKSGCLEANYTLLKIVKPGSNPDFKKTETDEFTYLGRMYDVVREWTKNDTTFYYCINDKQEDQLITGFQTIQKFAPGTGSSEKAKHTYALLYHVITVALLNERIVPVPKQPVTFRFCEYTCQPNTSCGAPEAPPPKG